jgi:hypothetical protein
MQNVHELVVYYVVRAKYGKVLLAARTDANRFWILLSGNAEVAFLPPTTTTTTPAAVQSQHGFEALHLHLSQLRPLHGRSR